MNIKYLDYFNLSKEEKIECFNFLKDEVNDIKFKSYVNMWNDDWRNKVETLPYILEKTERFSKNGQFIFLKLNEQIIACSGVYKSDFSNDVYIAGVRMWVNKNYRNMRIPRNFLLRKNKEWAINNKAKIIALTFNEYNKNLIKALQRNRIGEINNRINTREQSFLFHNGLVELKFPVLIKNTKQWIVYEQIDKNFNYDWNLIKY